MSYDITVGIPTYNRSNLLSRAIESALSQKGIRVEIIVSDNCSSDQTASIVDRYKHNIGFKYLRNTFNIGPIANYNQCLNHATGKYFMILGDDDWISDNYCEILTKSLGDEDAVFLGRCVATAPDGAIIEESAKDSFNLDGIEYITRYIDKNPKLRRHANFMLASKTEAFRAAGGFPNTEAAQHSDNMLLLKMLLTGKLIYNANAIIHYSVYPDSYGNRNIPSVAIASIQFVNFWDTELTPRLSNNLDRHRLKALRRKLIHSISLLYIDRILRYGGNLTNKLRLLRIFPKISWLLSTVFSVAFARAVFTRLGDTR